MSVMLQVCERLMGEVRRILALMALLATPASAETPRELPYPDQVDGLTVMQQVYFVNRHFAFENITIGTKSGPVRMVLKQDDRLNAANSLIRSLNNRPTSASVLFQDKVYFPTGKLRGTAILVISHLDRPATYSLWLPELRKVRRVSEPAHDDHWGGSPLTFGDVYFRKPSHEQHELLGRDTFIQCLGSLELNDAEAGKLHNKIPARSCFPRGRQVYRVKSSTLFDNWWYDYRIVTADQESFADYRSDYFKAGQLVKRIEKDWRQVAEHDQRAVMWRYWYAQDYVRGQQAIGYVSAEDVKWNQKVNPRDWSEGALRKIKR
jgi:hypothetical protein